MRFANGAIGTMDGGSALVDAGGNRHQVELRAIGSEGQFQIDLEREALWFFRAPDEDFAARARGERRPLRLRRPARTRSSTLPLGAPVENCSPGWLGARTVEMLDACYRSAASGAVAKVARRG